MEQSWNKWESYKVVKHETMGYAYFHWNKEAQMWQQCTNWFKKKANLRRHILKHYGHRIM